MCNKTAIVVNSVETGDFWLDRSGTPHGNSAHEKRHASGKLSNSNETYGYRPSFRLRLDRGYRVVRRGRRSQGQPIPRYASRWADQYRLGQRIHRADFLE